MQNDGVRFVCVCMYVLREEGPRTLLQAAAWSETEIEKRKEKPGVAPKNSPSGAVNTDHRPEVKYV